MAMKSPYMKNHRKSQKAWAKMVVKEMTAPNTVQMIITRRVDYDENGLPLSVFELTLRQTDKIEDELKLEENK